MPEIEVKATRSFSCTLGNFTRGRMYRLAMDPTVYGLIKGGYLVQTDQEVPDVPDAVDLAGLSEFSGARVGTGRTRPKKEKAGEQVNDGAGESEQGPDNPDGTALRPAAGATHGPGGSGRGKVSGS